MKVVWQDRDKSIFYVYAHYDSVGRVFYIGAGKKKRAFNKGSRPALWDSIAKNGGYTVKIWADNLTQENAFKMESEWIALYGRRINATGNLVNVTSGGLGTSMKRPDLSERNKGNKYGLGNKHNVGKIMPIEQRQKISQRLKGRPSPNKGNASPSRKKILCIENNKTYNCISDASKDLGICHGKVSMVINGHRKHAKGYTFSLIKENE
jgi:hypothetical protein